MALTHFLRRLVGGAGGGEDGGGAAAGTPVDYKGYVIRPTPTRQGGQWMTAGVITKDSPDGTREHSFVRAETHASQEGAEEFTVLKGKQIIDQQGDRLFEQRSQSAAAGAADSEERDA